MTIEEMKRKLNELGYELEEDKTNYWVNNLTKEDGKVKRLIKKWGFKNCLPYKIDGKFVTCYYLDK